MISAIRALLQFTTILPLGKTAPFDSFVCNSWLYPVSGYIIGGIAAIVILFIPSPPYVQAVIAIGIILLVSGANHFDALLDFGDGLMAHGNKERRIRALTDSQTGSGALALGIIITLLSVISLGSLQSDNYMAFSLIFGETGSKWAMELITISGKPFHEGIHATLHNNAKTWFLLPATILLIPVLFFPISLMGKIGAIILVIIVPLLMRKIAYRLFGGVNGDVTGATGEICRAAILVAIASLPP
jgi:adenosylcobinamide-GDP ribazoletransferase